MTNSTRLPGGVFKGKSLLYMQFQYNFQPIKGRS